MAPPTQRPRPPRPQGSEPPRPAIHASRSDFRFWVDGANPAYEIRLERLRYNWHPTTADCAKHRVDLAYQPSAAPLDLFFIGDGEEGFPAYLDSSIKGVYERAGVLKTNDGSLGSLTMIGTVSPARR